MGAGSAGCVLANRLSANSSNKVLLLEAGPSDKRWPIQMPMGLAHVISNKKLNWSFHSTPQKHINNRVLYLPQGRVLGGSSSINGMLYSRGHPHDYDRWEREGAEGWAYADCLPYFKRSDCHEFGEDAYRGGDGPLAVSRARMLNPLSHVFINAGLRCGYSWTSDMTGYQQEGFGTLDVHIHKGIRYSSYTAYLRANDVQRRGNLTIQSSSSAERILFEGTKAVGIDYTQGNNKNTARATEDIILSAGAINSPRLLMLSGVGNADDLKNLDIPVVAHLPGVGQNLQDHSKVDLQYRCKKPITLYSALSPFNAVKIGLQWFLSKEGLGTTSGVDAVAHIRSRPGIKHPDILIILYPIVWYDFGQTQANFHGFQFIVGFLRPTNIGSVTLKSRDPRQYPCIDPNYLSTEANILGLRDGIKHAREVVNHSSFDPFRGEELSPGSSVQTDKELDACVRAKLDPMNHFTSTCKMGKEDDTMAVVDNQTRVLGIENLRVVDASIMPSNLSGTPYAATVMMAEKAADIILGNKPLAKAYVPVWEPATLDTQRGGGTHKIVCPAE